MNTLADRIRTLIADLSPACFALVMSTGIVSLACDLAGLRLAARSLFWLNLAFYLILWLLTLLRLIFYPRNLWSDFSHHARGVGFFTMIAATCILGSQMMILKNAGAWAVAFWVLGLVLGLLLIYGVLTALVTRADKPSLAAGLNGNWLVLAVSIQSLSILTCLVVTQFPAHREELLFMALCLFLVGSMLSIWVISLIFHRILFFPLEPQAFEPSYWIMAGVDAITTLAGATLVTHSYDSRVLEPLIHFLSGFTLVFWAMATCWIPFLIILTAWRHLVGRVRLVYAPSYWGMVFPLGMYAACTLHLARIVHLSFLQKIGFGFVYAALVLWLLTLGGLVRSLLGSLWARPCQAK
ncbi:MAG: tellurite resistance/C4-dicarboxylate transporter family protein [Syntrophobacterales bacterium]|nr:tellurite resistance/C4-dicarboxylate transporter family protein [Syntrophobacterales bacterium]